MMPATVTSETAETRYTSSCKKKKSQHLKVEEENTEGSARQENGISLTEQSVRIMSATTDVDTQKHCQLTNKGKKGFLLCKMNNDHALFVLTLLLLSAINLDSSFYENVILSGTPKKECRDVSKHIDLLHIIQPVVCLSSLLLLDINLLSLKKYEKSPPSDIRIHSQSGQNFHY